MKIKTILCRVFCVLIIVLSKQNGGGGSFLERWNDVSLSFGECSTAQTRGPILTKLQYVFLVFVLHFYNFSMARKFWGKRY